MFLDGGLCALVALTLISKPEFPSNEVFRNAASQCVLPTFVVMGMSRMGPSRSINMLIDSVTRGVDC